MLTSNISLAVEMQADWRAGTAFFALARGETGVSVEHGEVLADLQNNAILDALVSLHEREREAFESGG